MTQFSQKKKKYPKNGFFDTRIKIFHKSKIDGLKKLTLGLTVGRFTSVEYTNWPIIRVSHFFNGEQKWRLRDSNFLPTEL